MIDFRQRLRDFISEGRRAQREVFFPSLLDSRLFVQQEKQINRHQNETEQKTCDAKKSADALHQNGPELFQHDRECLLQLWHLFFYVSLNALAFSSGQLWRAWCNYFGRRRGGGWRRGRDCCCLFLRRSRWRGADEPVRKACGCRFPVRTA